MWCGDWDWNFSIQCYSITGNSNGIIAWTLLSNALLATELTTDPLKKTCVVSLLPPPLWFFFLYVTVAPSRVYKLLPLLRCLSAGGSESCVYAGFTRCWFSRWTDDRLSQQLRRQIHSPTLSSLPPRFFLRLLCLRTSVLVLLPLLTRTISMFWHFSLFLLVSAWHIGMEGPAETKTLPFFCVWIAIMILQDCKLTNYYFKTAAKQKKYGQCYWMLHYTEPCCCESSE